MVSVAHYAADTIFYVGKRQMAHPLKPPLRITAVPPLSVVARPRRS